MNEVCNNRKLLFLVQALTDIIMVLAKVKANITHFTIKETFKIYLNICWHSYYKKDDSYVSDKIDNILRSKTIKSCFCLIHWLKDIGDKMIDLISISNLSNYLKELDKLETIEEKQGQVKSQLEMIYRFLDINFTDLQCSSECIDCKKSYNGLNIFKENDPVIYFISKM